MCFGFSSWLLAQNSLPEEAVERNCLFHKVRHRDSDLPLPSPSRERFSDLPCLVVFHTTPPWRGSRPYPEGRDAAQRDQEESEQAGLTRSPSAVHLQSCLCSQVSTNPRGQAWRAGAPGKGTEPSRPFPSLPLPCLCISATVSVVTFVTIEQ